MSTEDLILALRRLNDATDVPASRTGMLDCMHELVMSASDLAYRSLIDREGNCLWGEIAKVKEAGFWVFPVEQDSFGWLIGGIETKHGCVTFG